MVWLNLYQRLESDEKSQQETYKKLYSQFEELHRIAHYSPRATFDDFCTIAMAAQHNLVYSVGKFPIPRVYNATHDKLEQEYLTAVAKYQKHPKAVEILLDIYATLAVVMRQDPYDYLGNIYMDMDMDMNTKCAGQFFTPAHICEFMALVAYDKDIFERDLKGKGFVCMEDGCCGSGAMAIGFAKVAEKDFNACDLDAKVLFSLGILILPSFVWLF